MALLILTIESVLYYAQVVGVRRNTAPTTPTAPAGKAQINYRDLVINLYTAYHSIHDEFSQKLYRKKFTEDRQTLRQRKQRNTAPTAPAK